MTWYQITNWQNSPNFMISTFNEKTLAFKSYREASVLMIACRFRKYPGKQTHSVILVCAAALLEKKLKSRMY